VRSPNVEPLESAAKDYEGQPSLNFAIDKGQGVTYYPPVKPLTLHMDAKEIKKFLIDKELTISEIAQEIGEDITAVSRVLNYQRETERIRRKLQRKYRIRFEKAAQIAEKVQRRKRAA